MKYLVVHHSGSTNDTLEGVRRYHKKKYGRTYYNIVIDRNGDLHNEHREWNYRGEGSVSKDVCILGDFTKEVPTDKQLATLGVVLHILKTTYNLSEPIPHKEAHKQMEATKSECPGKLMEYLDPADTIKIKVHRYGVDDSLVEKWIKEAEAYYYPLFKLDFEFDKQDIDKPTFLFNGYPNYHDYNVKYPSPISLVYLSPEVAEEGGFLDRGINYNNGATITNYVVAHEFDWKSGTPGYSAGLNTTLHELRHAIVDRYRNHVDDQSIPDTTHYLEKEAIGEPNFLQGLASFTINQEEDMKLTKEQVRKLNALWGVDRDENAEEYWAGRELDELLDARIKDEIKELTQLT